MKRNHSCTYYFHCLSCLCKLEYIYKMCKCMHNIYTILNMFNRKLYIHLESRLVDGSVLFCFKDLPFFNELLISYMQFLFSLIFIINFMRSYLIHKYIRTNNHISTNFNNIHSNREKVSVRIMLSVRCFPFENINMYVTFYILRSVTF